MIQDVEIMQFSLSYMTSVYNFFLYDYNITKYEINETR
jgi:hypothetical protein